MGTVSARETDQYLSWDIELQDSAPLINGYLDKAMQSVLDNPENKHKSCQDLSKKFYQQLIGPYTFSELSIWAQNGKDMQSYRFPSVGKSEYVKESIYGGEGASPIIRWVIGLAPTLNINGIYLGTDKLGHISYMGNKYYKKYLKLRKKGLDEDKAISKVLEGGIRSEVVLGGFYGTSSISDLEGNYQGLRLAIDLCEGKNPILSKEDGKWSVDKERLKIQNYVTPEMDESYYPIIFGKLTWNDSVKERIQKICAEKDLTIVKKRFAYYRENFQKSRNILIMNAKMQLDPKFDNSKFSYQKVCGLDF